MDLSDVFVPLRLFGLDDMAGNVRSRTPWRKRSFFEGADRLAQSPGRAWIRSLARSRWLIVRISLFTGGPGSIFSRTPSRPEARIAAEAEVGIAGWIGQPEFAENALGPAPEVRMRGLRLFLTRRRASAPRIRDQALVGIDQGLAISAMRGCEPAGRPCSGAQSRSGAGGIAGRRRHSLRRGRAPERNGAGSVLAKERLGHERRMPARGPARFCDDESAVLMLSAASTASTSGKSISCCPRATS